MLVRHRILFLLNRYLITLATHFSHISLFAEQFLLSICNNIFFLKLDFFYIMFGLFRIFTQFKC